MNDSTQRYTGFAIGLHWVLAILIIGMLALGLFMVELGEADPLRFQLTQWHKSFGIIALILIVLRILWRVTHRPPALPAHMKSWEKLAAELTHIALYLVILLIPISGWIMVSASPLDLPTLLFNGIHWPHLPPFDTLPDKEAVSELFLNIHTLAGYALIALLLAHVGAALRHRFMLHDEVMSRMSPKAPDGGRMQGVVPVFVIVSFIILALITYGYSGSSSPPLAAGSSRVNFTFSVQGQTAEGTFPESTVELKIDNANPTVNSLNATVNTTTVSAGNSQVDSTLQGSDWFDVDNHPQAEFISTELLPVSGGSYSAAGTLRIRDITNEIAFPVNLETSESGQLALGQFTVDRRDFNLGMSSQPDDETVGFEVVVQFEFEVR